MVEVGQRYRFHHGEAAHLPAGVQGKVSTYYVPEETPPIPFPFVGEPPKTIKGVDGDWVHLINEETKGVACITQKTLMGHRPFGSGRWELVS